MYLVPILPVGMIIADLVPDEHQKSIIAAAVLQQLLSLRARQKPQHSHHCWGWREAFGGGGGRVTQIVSVNWFAVEWKWEHPRRY